MRLPGTATRTSTIPPSRRSGRHAPDTSYTYSLTSPSWTDPTGAYAASLDAFDRAVSLDDPADAGNFTWTYGTGGEVLAAGIPNGNTMTQSLDAAGHLTLRETRTGSTSRARYDYTHNRAGLVLSEDAQVTGDSSNGTIDYRYDPLGRLTTAGATAYAWDAATNRTGAGSSTTAFDAANRPLSGTSPTASYTSDADGQLTARPGQTMTWDHLGRLTSVTTASGTAAYTYDPLDRLRTAQAPDGSRIRFRYTGLTTSAAQWIDDIAGTVTRSIGNGWTGERLLDWTGTGSERRYHGTNAHHDTTWLAKDDGTVLASLRYDPWGVPRSAVPAGYTPFRFQGSWHDASTDLAWVVTRWYAPSLGTFTSEDSLLGEPIDPDSRHLYAYAAGEPVGSWDPDGRYWYVSRSGDTLGSIARSRMPTAMLWRAVFNANRGISSPKSWLPKPRQAQAASTVGPGHCMWLPWRLFSFRASPKSDARCTGRDLPGAYKRHKQFFSQGLTSNWAAQAKIALLAMADEHGTWTDYANSFLNISPSEMIVLTALVTDRVDTDRPRDGDVKANVQPANWIARRYLDGTFAARAGRLVSGTPMSHVKEYCGNSSLPQDVDTGAAGFTLGESIFWTRGECPDGSGSTGIEALTLRSHEYIHVLEFQEIGSVQMLDYVNQSYDLAYGGTAWNRYESPAYLWNAWTWIYKEPSWQYFHAAN